MNKEMGKEMVVYPQKDGKGIRVSDLTHMVDSSYDRVFDKETK
jgi:hypothetical protein